MSVELISAIGASLCVLMAIVGSAIGIKYDPEEKETTLKETFKRLLGKEFIGLYVVAWITIFLFVLYN